MHPAEDKTIFKLDSFFFRIFRFNLLIPLSEHSYPKYSHTCHASIRFGSSIRRSIQITAAGGKGFLKVKGHPSGNVAGRDN